MEPQTKTNRPNHSVYVVKGEGKIVYWTKVGAGGGHNRTPGRCRPAGWSFNDCDGDGSSKSVIN